MITAFQSDLPAGRQRYLALGRYYQAVVAEIRSRGLEAALEFAATKGGASQKKSIARSLLKELERHPEFAATPYTVNREAHDGVQYMHVLIPHLSWHFRGRRQVGVLEMLPLFGAKRRPGFKIKLP